MYKTQRNYENVQRAIYDGIGEYQVPQIAPTQYEGSTAKRPEGNYTGKTRRTKRNLGISSGKRRKGMV